METMFFPSPFLLWILLAAGFGAVVTYLLSQQRLAALKLELEKIQMEADEIEDFANRKIREYSHQLSITNRKLEDLQQELSLCSLNHEQDRQRLTDEIRQLNIQLAASENEMNIMRIYWARKENEWKAVQEGLNDLLSEKEAIIADLHSSLARLAAEQANYELRRQEERPIREDANTHSSLL
ncbi:hypothetical protein [Rhodoflexus sp.]